MLAFNRLTAIVWWKSHTQVWSRHYPKVVVFIFAYPFLLNGYSFINYKCRFLLRDCKDPNSYWVEDALVTGIINGVIAISALIVTMVTVYFYHFQFNQNPTITSTQKTEQKLVIQAFVLSFTYVCYCITHAYCQAFNPSTDVIDISQFVGRVAMDFIYFIHHLWAYVLIFVLS